MFHSFQFNGYGKQCKWIKVIKLKLNYVLHLYWNKRRTFKTKLLYNKIAIGQQSFQSRSQTAFYIYIISLLFLFFLFSKISRRRRLFLHLIPPTPPAHANVPQSRKLVVIPGTSFLIFIVIGKILSLDIIIINLSKGFHWI